MKIIYAIVLALMILISACAQQQPAQPQQPSPQPTPVPETPVEETEVIETEEESEEVLEEPKRVVAGEVRILGKEGFQPLEMMVDVGDTVTWINDDQKALTLTMFKDGRWYVNSDVIEPGEQFEVEFTEAGEYEYWTIAFGPAGAKIVVE